MTDNKNNNLVVEVRKAYYKEWRAKNKEKTKFSNQMNLERDCISLNYN